MLTLPTKRTPCVKRVCCTLEYRSDYNYTKYTVCHNTLHPHVYTRLEGTSNSWHSTQRALLCDVCQLSDHKQPHACVHTQEQRNDHSQQLFNTRWDDITPKQLYLYTHSKVQQFQLLLVTQNQAHQWAKPEHTIATTITGRGSKPSIQGALYYHNGQLLWSQSYIHVAVGCLRQRTHVKLL